jgi:hypothetical protein
MAGLFPAIASSSWKRDQYVDGRNNPAMTVK